VIAPSWAQSYLLSFTGIGRVDATETLVVVVESDLEPGTGGILPARVRYYYFRPPAPSA
jgi:hypothetical protein